MVLVTGGTGLLGSALVRRLRSDGQQVRVFSRKAHRQAGVGDSVSGNVADPAALQEAMRGVTHVYHLAALVDHYASDEDLQRVNVAGTVNVALAAAGAGVQRLIHCSSVSAEPGGGSTAYGRSKSRAEQALRDLEGRLPIVTLRPGPIYCEGRPTLRRVVGMVRRTRLCPVLAPDLTIHLASRRNVVEALIRAGQRGEPGRPYVVCDREPVRRSVLSRIVATQAGARLVPVPLPILRHVLWGTALSAEVLARWGGRKPRFTRSYLRVLSRERRYDISAAEADLGYDPHATEVDFADVVKRCVDLITRGDDGLDGVASRLPRDP